MKGDSLTELQHAIVAFRDERDWQQFHSLRNLAAQISIESGELLEHFLWEEVARHPEAVEDEVADILYGLLLFCYEAGIDLPAASRRKMLKNAAKYPVEKAKGSPKKYTDL